MRIAITSDIHFTPHKEDMVIQLAQNIQRCLPDILCIAGDIGEGQDNFEQCLTIFQTYVHCKIAVCCGNHDLWFSDNTEERFDNLANITKKLGMCWLDSHNLNHRDVSIVGSYLHYDYSAKVIDLPDEYYKINKKHMNRDAWYMLGIDDMRFANELGIGFLERLNNAKNPRIVVITHIPCISHQLIRKPNDITFSLGTAYMGNITYEKHILSNERVTDIVSGHVHNKRFVTINGINIQTIGADYNNYSFVILGD